MTFSYKVKKLILQIFKNPFFVVWGPTSYKLKGEDVRKIIDIIQPGDILLRRYDSYISGLMIPGYFTHAALYTNKNKITHMVGTGIGQEDILTFTRCDNLCLIRCNNQERVKKALEYAELKLKENVAYDYDFDFSDATNMSCTEFVCNAYSVLQSENIIEPDELLALPNIDTDFEIKYRKG